MKIKPVKKFYFMLFSPERGESPRLDEERAEEKKEEKEKKRKEADPMSCRIQQANRKKVGSQGPDTTFPMKFYFHPRCTSRDLSHLEERRRFIYFSS